MDRFARIVLGYHGAKAGNAADYVKRLLLGEVGVEEWEPSENEPMLTEVQTVRGAFEEGDAAFPGAALKMETHIQIAVRNRQSILGIFRPTIDNMER